MKTIISHRALYLKLINLTT